MTLVAGAVYDLSFWAKSSQALTVDAGVQQQYSPYQWLAVKTYGLTSNWQQFSMSFSTTALMSPVKVQFNLGQSSGTVWFDGVNLTDPPTAPGATATATAMNPTSTNTVAPTATAAKTATSVAPTSTATSTPASPTATSTLATPTSTATAVAAAGGTVQDYPRIANMYTYGWEGTSQASSYSRFGLVVGEPPATTSGSLAALKAQSPAGIAVVYFDTVTVQLPNFDGKYVYPGWYLTLAGTTLTVNINATTTSIPVANGNLIQSTLSSNPDVLVDGESMHVTAVNGNTLTVARGYISTAASHSSGARIAPHADDNWPGVWQMNVTPYCPTDPATGYRWTDYLAHYAATTLAAGPWNGVFLDEVNSDPGNKSLDANNDNAADGGNGPSGTGWADGQTSLFNLMRSLAPSTILIGNGNYYSAAQQNGEEFEHFPDWYSSWSDGYAAYSALAAPGGPAPISIINPDTNDTGTQNLQTMRFGLATALLGNGYYAYDIGITSHGQTWWYDEYDNGAGSSIAAGTNASQTTLSIAPGSGSKFKVGDVVRVPGNATTYDDEQMLVTAVNGDTLTVQRGYNGSSASSHNPFAKVFTATQIAAGQGWLGQPLAAATSLGTNVWRRDFTHGTVLINAGSSPQTVAVGSGYRRIAGTQDPATNNGASVTSVTVPPQDGLLLVKAS